MYFDLIWTLNSFKGHRKDITLTLVSHNYLYCKVYTQPSNLADCHVGAEKLVNKWNNETQRLQQNYICRQQQTEPQYSVISGIHFVQ